MTGSYENEGSSDSRTNEAPTTKNDLRKLHQELYKASKFTVPEWVIEKECSTLGVRGHRFQNLLNKLEICGGWANALFKVGSFNNRQGKDTRCVRVTRVDL